MGKLDEKVALITGAGSGMGRSAALLFAREGAKVAVADFVPAGGEETVKMIKGAGGNSIFIHADVSKATDVERMVNTTVDTYGRIDILYNNAGTNQEMNFTTDIKEEEWDRVMNVNLKSVFLGSKYAIPVMLGQNGGGVIINTASTAGIFASPVLAAYSASKAGVVQLTKAMALEYGRLGIRINCICPGATQTPMLEESIIPIDVAAQMIPLGRVGQPDEVAQAALYLASDDSAIIHGIALVADGGLTAGIPLPASK